MQFLCQRGTDADPLLGSLDVDSVQLRLRASAVIVQEPDDLALTFGDQEMRVGLSPTTFDRLAEGGGRIALLDDAVYDSRVAQVAIGFRHGNPGDGSDGLAVLRPRVPDSRSHPLQYHAPDRSNEYSLEEHLSRQSDPELTTTSYAILGFLSIRDWSTYELAKQVRRNLHFFWPRAESNLYAEPHRLVAAGLAVARSEPVGRRRRTVYSITPKGRQELRVWIGQPALGTRLESEAMVKLMFATEGSRFELIENLRRMRDDADARQRALSSIFHEYLRGEDQFPERLHVNVLCYRLLWDYAQAESRWAHLALQQAKGWRDVKTPEPRSRLLGALRNVLGLRGGEGPATGRADHSLSKPS
jgi:PadR family transcriptional regulator, regulatory protein AphA